MTANPPITVRRLTEKNCSAQDRMRIIQLCLLAFKGDIHIAALTAGRNSLEAPFFQAQLDTALLYGQLYVAIVGGSIEGVCMAYAPGQDFVLGPLGSLAPHADYLCKLTPDMQQWWTSHLRPKYAELTNAAMGGSEARKESWYVRLLAVSPDKQRHGIGRQLLESVVQMADDANRKACLETYIDKQVRFCAKSGFRVRATKNIGSYSGGFPLFFMVREPNTK